MSGLSKLLLSTLGIASLLPGPATAQQPEPRILVEVPFQEHQAQTLLDLDLDVWEMERPPNATVVATATLRVSEAELADLSRLGFRPRVLDEDIYATWERLRAQWGLPEAGPESPEAETWQQYHTWEQADRLLDTLQAAHPEISAVFTLGRSLEGRDIRGIRISDDAANIDISEPAMAIMGCHHAREWISVEVPLYTAWYLLTNYASNSQVRELVDRGEYWIVPVVNPDGLVYSHTTDRFWRKNRRLNNDGTYGVDPNRNYSYRWGAEGASDVPSSEVYRGTGPFSEPETQAIRSFFENYRSFVASLDYHSYSQLVMVSWAYTRDPPTQSTWLEYLAGSMAQTINANHQGSQYNYRAGRVSTILYLVSGGLLDYVYGNFGIPAITVELRPGQGAGIYGFVLPPEQILPTSIENYYGTLDYVYRTFPTREVPPDVLDAAVTDQFGTDHPPIRIFDRDAVVGQAVSAPMETPFGQQRTYWDDPLPVFVPGPEGLTEADRTVISRITLTDEAAHGLNLLYVYHPGGRGDHPGSAGYVRVSLPWRITRTLVAEIDNSHAGQGVAIDNATGLISWSGRSGVTGAVSLEIPTCIAVLLEQEPSGYAPRTANQTIPITTDQDIAAAFTVQWGTGLPPIELFGRPAQAGAVVTAPLTRLATPQRGWADSMPRYSRCDSFDGRYTEPDKSTISRISLGRATLDGERVLVIVRHGGGTGNNPGSSGYVALGNGWEIEEVLVGAAVDRTNNVISWLERNCCTGCACHRCAAALAFVAAHGPRGPQGLSITASAAGVPITVSPADMNQLGDGSAPFERDYIYGTAVTLTAPLLAATEGFTRWVLDGASQPLGRTGLVLSMIGDHDAHAVYSPLPVLNVDSDPPVDVAVSPEDVLRSGDGRTPFQRTYLAGQSVTLTAPSFAGLHTFVRWQRDGLDQPVGQRSLTLEVAADGSAKASYAPFPILSVVSLTAVEVDLSPPDEEGNAGGTTPLTRVYRPGTAVTVTVPPFNGADEFVRWDGGGESARADGTSLSLILDESREAEAVYRLAPVLSVSSSVPAEIGVTPADALGRASGRTPLARSYGTGSAVTLTAPPAVGEERFVWWTLDDIRQPRGQRTLNLSLGQNRRGFAFYSRPKQLSVAFDESAVYRVAVTPADDAGLADSSVPFTRLYDYQTEVELTAFPGDGYRFDGWSGDVPPAGEMVNPLPLTMDRDRNLVARFVRIWRLTVETNRPEAGVITPGPGVHVFDEGTEVPLSAWPHPGYLFGRWTGDVPQSEAAAPSVVVPMTLNRLIRAEFDVRTYPLSVAVTPEGAGDVSLEPDLSLYEHNQEVLITVTPRKGYQFDHWSIGLPLEGNPVRLVMDSPRSLVAVLVPSNGVSAAPVNVRVAPSPGCGALGASSAALLLAASGGWGLRLLRRRRV